MVFFEIFWIFSIQFIGRDKERASNKKALLKIQDRAFT
jgi:hypothetical protein